MATPNITINNQGTLVLVTPESPRAQDWFRENVAQDGATLGRGVRVRAPLRPGRSGRGGRGRPHGRGRPMKARALGLLGGAVSAPGSASAEGACFHGADPLICEFRALRLQQERQNREHARQVEELRRQQQQYQQQPQTCLIWCGPNFCVTQCR
jgi:hypothetical protein